MRLFVVQLGTDVSSEEESKTEVLLAWAEYRSRGPASDRLHPFDF